jgi:hypothetical protein
MAKARKIKILNGKPHIQKLQSIPEPIFDKLDKKCKKEGLNMTFFINEAIDEKIKKVTK